MDTDGIKQMQSCLLKIFTKKMGLKPRPSFDGFVGELSQVRYNNKWQCDNTPR
jgi:hypothetical protein